MPLRGADITGPWHGQWPWLASLPPLPGQLPDPLWWPVECFKISQNLFKRIRGTDQISAQASQGLGQGGSGAGMHVTTLGDPMINYYGLWLVLVGFRVCVLLVFHGLTR